VQSCPEASQIFVQKQTKPENHACFTFCRRIIET